MTNRKTLQFNRLSFIPLLIGILAIYLRQLFNHDFIGVLFLLFAVAFSVWYYVFNLKKCVEGVNISVAVTGAVIDILAINFFLVNFALISSYCTAFAVVCYLILFIALLAIKGFFLIKKAKGFEFARFKKKTVFVVVCLLISVLSNVGIFKTWFRWDSYIYLFDFYKLSPLSVFQSGGLRVAQHITFTYSLFAILIQSLLHIDMAYVVLGINVAIMFGEMLIWNALLEKYAKDANEYLRMIFSVVFAFSPYVFGLLYTINLEQVMLFGVLLFFLAEAKDDVYLLVLSAFITCNSKETGTVLVICMMGALVVKQLINALKGKEKGERFKAIVNECDLLVYSAVIIIGVLWLLDFTTSKWGDYNSELPLNTVDKSAFNGISVSFVFIISKLKSLLLANFNWLIIIAIAILAILLLIKTSDKKAQILAFINKFALPLACLFGQIVFSLLFVTYNHFRYWQAVIATLYLLLFCSIAKIGFNNIIKFSTAGVMGALFVIQSYVTIDPLMRVAHANLNTGVDIVVSAQDNVLGRGEAVFTDSTCNNRQIFYFDEALSLAIASVNYDGGCGIAYSAEFRAQSVGGEIGSLYMITGFGYEYMDVVRYVAWNDVKKRRYLTTDENKAMQFLYVDASMDWNVIKNLNERIYYIEMPWETEIEKIKELKNITLTKETQIEHKGWKLNVYRVS